MSLLDLKDYREFLAASTELDLYWDSRGNISLAPSNLFPNQYGQETGSGGTPSGAGVMELASARRSPSEPEEWDLSGMPPPLVGHHFNVSMPGAPKKSTLTRQTASYVPLAEGSWTAQGAWAPGVKGAVTARGTARGRSKPPPPVVETAPNTSRGYAAGRYGWAWGTSGKWGRTTTTAVRFFDLLNNEVPKLPVPDSFSAGSENWDLYLTRKSGDESTLLEQRSVPISELDPGGEYTLTGPWRNHGAPPATNRSGIEVPRSQRHLHYRTVNSRHDCLPGKWRPAVAIANERGISLASFLGLAITIKADTVWRKVPGPAPAGLEGSGSFAGNLRDENRKDKKGDDEQLEQLEEQEFHWERVTLKYRENTALFHETPEMVRRNPELKWTIYWRHEAENGTLTWYRAYPKQGRRGTATYFEKKGRFVRGVEVNGYVPEEEPGGLNVGLIQEDPPTENTTVIEAPDPASLPDTPGKGGTETLPPGRFLASVQGVLEGGGLTNHSEPQELLDANRNPRNLTAQELLKIVPAVTVNVLRGAEVSKLDAQGKPEHWTPFNTASTQPGYYDATSEPGVLILGTVTAAAEAPRMQAKVYSVDSETVLTVGATVSAAPVGSSFIGSVRVVLRQFDEGMNYISDLLVGDLTQAGQVSFEKQFGAGADSTPFAPAAAFVAFMPQLAGATVLARARFFNMFMFPFPSAIRKLSGDPASPFEAMPSTPFPGDSYAAVGVPAELPGQVAEPEPPVEVLDFEGGSVPDSWGAPISNAPHLISVEETNPLFGARSLRIRDVTASALQYGHYKKTFAQMEGTLFAARAIYAIDQRPTFGFIQFHLLSNTLGTPVAFADLAATGQLSLWLTISGRRQKFPIATIPNGARLDLEIAFVAGKQGRVRVSLGLNGAARSQVFSRAADFGTQRVRTFSLGTIYANDSRMRYDLRMDQVVITEGGDVLNREQPPPPAEYVLPPRDRPVTYAGTSPLPRQFDELGKPIKQLVVFLKPGDAPAEAPVILPLLKDPQPLRPGLSYGVGAFARYSVFTEQAAPGIRVWLEGEEGENTAPVLALSLLPMSGKRGWQSDSQGDSNGATEDDYGTFTVPLDGRYTRARFEVVLHDGFYVIQEPLLHRGSLPVFAEHDAKRGYGRAPSATGEFIFDCRPDAYDLGLQMPVFYSEFGVKPGLPGEPEEDEGTVTTGFWRSSNRLAFEPYETLGDTPYRYLKTRLTLARSEAGGEAEPHRGPTIPAGGVYLRTWQPGYGNLLRSDESHFPGVAQVSNDLVYVAYPDIEVGRVGGHHQSTPQGDVIGRLYDLKIVVYTEAALREIEALSLQDELVITVPTAGGTVGGESYRVRLRSLARFAVRDFAPSVRDGHRWLLAQCELEEAEVLQAGALPEPLEAVDFSRALPGPPAGA